MKKSLLIFCLVSTATGFAQIHIKDTIVGQIRSCRETIYPLKASKEIITTVHLSLIESQFPTIGGNELAPQHIRDEWYNYTISRNLNYYREYDNAARKVKEKWEDYLSNLETVFTYKYDTLNRVIEIKEFDDGEARITERRSYNYNGQLVTKLTDYTDFYMYSYYEYNDKNECIKICRFDERGKATETHYVYENGKLTQLKTLSDSKVAVIPGVSRTYTKGDWVEKLIEEYFYDEKGNRVKTCNYDSVLNLDTSEPYCTRYTYDGKGNKTSTYVKEMLKEVITYYPDGKTKRIQWPRNKMYIEYYYKGDLLIKVIQRDGKEKNTIEFSYIFDDRNNWVQQTKSVNGKPAYIRQRAIVYYEPVGDFKTSTD